MWVLILMRFSNNHQFGIESTELLPLKVLIWQIWGLQKDHSFIFIFLIWHQKSYLCFNGNAFAYKISCGDCNCCCISSAVVKILTQKNQSLQDDTRCTWWEAKYREQSWASLTQLDKLDTISIELGVCCVCPKPNKSDVLVHSMTVYSPFLFATTAVS
jgi:hypothetical protein